jgi:diguanylate cyclase (GGDEF)-like protein/PAS domain S-box-containing protein
MRPVAEWSSSDVASRAEDASVHEASAPRRWAGRNRSTVIAGTTSRTADAHDRPRRTEATERPATPRSALEDSELRYRRLFESAKDGIIVLDAGTGRITDVNPFLREMLGYSHDELLGKQLWEIGPTRDIAASQQAMRQLQDREYIRYEDLPLENRTKEPVPVEFVSNVYAVGGLRVIQCNVREITARKRAEDDLRRLNDELVARVAEMTRRGVELNRLNQMYDLLHACETQEEAYKVIALTAAELFVGQSGFLAMLRPRDQRLVTAARWGEGESTTPSFAASDCWAMRRGQPHAVVDPHVGLVCRHLVDQPASGYLCVPLTVHGEALGLLCVRDSANDATQSPVTERLAVAMGEGIKLSLSNLRLRERLREQATLDVLTGLHNRRYLDETLARESHRALRRQSPLCVAMLDLDDFKLFNDTYGHGAGDALLRELGRLLRQNLRKSDVSCRYGGEEFALLLPDSALADTRQRVEQIRQLVKQMDVRHADRPLGRVTVSCGIAQMNPQGEPPGELLRAADQALYAAKLAGRDRVVVREPS